MSQHTEALFWLLICAVGIVFAGPNLLNALAVMHAQIESGINGLRSLIVRGHIRTATFRLIELACLGAIALPVVTPLRWPTWVAEVLLFVVVTCLALASIGDWRDRRVVVHWKGHE